MKVALADVLWEAANVWLADDEMVQAKDFDSKQEQDYSCHAVSQVLSHSSPMVVNRVFRFLRSLGCNPKLSGFLTWERSYCWDEWGDGPQGVRYMWLLLAMHCAEDEGIYLETVA